MRKVLTVLCFCYILAGLIVAPSFKQDLNQLNKTQLVQADFGIDDVLGGIAGYFGAHDDRPFAERCDYTRFLTRHWVIGIFCPGGLGYLIGRAIGGEAPNAWSTLK